MNSASASAPLSRPQRAARLVGDKLLGMLLFVMVEVMVFVGLISAFIIVKAALGPALWPPPGQPRLPIWSTAINTTALLASGAILRSAWSRYSTAPSSAAGRVTLSIWLGVFFLVFQGAEWARLLAAGLTLTSSSLGSFFYLIIGCHALHAASSLALLIYSRWRLSRGTLDEDLFAAVSVFWGFVVLLWPVLYGLVYLG